MMTNIIKKYISDSLGPVMLEDSFLDKELPVVILQGLDEKKIGYDGQTIKYKIELLAKDEDEIRNYECKIKNILSKILVMHNENIKYTCNCETESIKINFDLKEHIWHGVILMKAIVYCVGEVE